MSSFDNNNSTSIPDSTATSMGATGATTLVAAPGAGSRLAIDRIRVYLATNTTGLVEMSFREGASGSLKYRTYGNSIGTAPLSVDFTNPWILDTATAFQAVCSVTAASTPTVYIDVSYRIVAGNLR